MPVDTHADAARASEPLYTWWYSVLPRLFGVPAAGPPTDEADGAGRPFPVDLAQRGLALTQALLEGLVGAGLQALAASRPGDEGHALQDLVLGRVAGLSDKLMEWGRTLSGGNAAALGAALTGAPMSALQASWQPVLLNIERAYGGLGDAIGLGPLRQLQQAAREWSLAVAAQRQAQFEYMEVVAGAAAQGAEALTARLAEMGRQGESVDSLLALVRLWARVTDEAMHRAMQTPRALEASAKVLRASIRARAEQQRVVAIASQALDVPTRSDLDDAYREIQELKRALRRLRKTPREGDAPHAPDADREASPRAVAPVAESPAASPSTGTGRKRASAGSKPASATGTARTPRRTKASGGRRAKESEAS